VANLNDWLVEDQVEDTYQSSPPCLANLNTFYCGLNVPPIKLLLLLARLTIAPTQPLEYSMFAKTFAKPCTILVPM
jgi:hypothetical protein